MTYPEYQIDPITLREILKDPKQTYQWCLIHHHNPEVVSYLRMLGMFDEAKRLGLKHIENATSSTTKITATLRYATVLQWTQKTQESIHLFLHCIAQAQRESNPIIEAFAHQHLAKLYLENEQIDDATTHALKAHQLRSEYDPDRLFSTQMVLDVIETIKGR